MPDDYIDMTAITAPGSVDIPPTTPGAGGTGSAGRVPEDVQPAESSTQHVPEENEKRDRPEWETAQDLQDYWKTRKTFFTDDERAKSWEVTAKIVEKYSDEMVDRWNKEIDVLLVYAGLFSAIQTAFNIELYKLLNPTPNPDPDPVLVALESISAQLGGFALNQAYLNSTQPPFVLRHSAPSAAAVPLWVVWVNALWFASLVSSLASAFIGIMVKQWLTEYEFGVSGTSRQSARLRQLRLNSLERWRVKEIVSILSVLLQIASGLFFAGLLILLWNLNCTVAIVGTVFVGILVVFSLSTIVLPTFATHCAYLSPPSRAFYELTRPLRTVLYPLRRRLCFRILGWYGLHLLSLESGEVRADFRRNHPFPYRLCQLLDGYSHLKWRGMEGALVSQCSEDLDGDMVAKAYTTTMDVNYLRHAAVCTTELTLNATRTCFEAIRSANIVHWGKDWHRWPMQSVHPCMWSGIVISSLIGDTPWSLSHRLKTACSYIWLLSPHIRSDTSRTRLFCTDFARIIRHYGPDALPHDGPEIAGHSLLDDLMDVMAQTTDLSLGNDVRQYVAYTCAGETIESNWSEFDDSGAKRALSGLRSIIQCVVSPDCKPNDPGYQTLRAQAVRSLEAFAKFLATPRALVPSIALKIDKVLEELLEDNRGERAGIISTALIQTIVTYLEAYKIENGRPFTQRWDTYLQTLICKVADSSGQYPATAIMISALRTMEGRLSSDTPESVIGDYIIWSFLNALVHIISCLNPLRSSECILENSAYYDDARETARRALITFSVFLSTSEAGEWAGRIDDVFDELREYGSQAGLLSAELINAIVRYRDAYEGAHQDTLPEWWGGNKEWIEKLRRDLDNLEQHAAAGNVTSMSAGAEVPLTVNMASSGADDYVVNASDPQPSQPDDGPHAVAYDRGADPEPNIAEALTTDRSSVAENRPLTSSG